MASAARRRYGIGAALLGTLLLSMVGCGGSPGGTAPQAADGQALTAAAAPMAANPAAATVNTNAANAMGSLVGLAAATSVVNAPMQSADTLPTSTSEAAPGLLTAQAGPLAPTAEVPESTARKRKADRYCASMRQHVYQQAAARHRSNSRLESRLGGCWDWSEEE